MYESTDSGRVRVLGEGILPIFQNFQIIGYTISYCKSKFPNNISEQRHYMSETEMFCCTKDNEIMCK